MRLFIIAMESEAKDIIKDFKLIQLEPFKVYKRNNDLLAITGIGKVNAAFVLTSVSLVYDFDFIVNIGFAGAVGDFKIGDVVAIDNATYHDFDLTVFGYEHGQVPKLPTYYESDKTLLSKTSFKKAMLYTGDYFMTKQREGNYVVDMEGTALYQVAYLRKTPIVSIKIISDVIGSKNNVEDYKDFENKGSLKIYSIINDVCMKDEI